MRRVIRGRRVLGSGVAAVLLGVSLAGGVALAAPSVPGAEGGPMVEQVYQAAKRAVVLIRVLVPAAGSGDQPQEVLGSGFFVDAQGDILTADHVVQGAKRVFVTLYGGQTLRAHVDGEDQGDDLALVHVDLPRDAGVSALSLRAAPPEPGEPVVVIGNPLGYVDTVTAGVVSGVGGDSRDLTGLDGHMIRGTVQTDAPVDSGNSGGPLLDAAGRVLGVIDALDGHAIGLAVPAGVVRGVLPKLEGGAPVVYPWIGIAGDAIDPVAAVAERLPVNRGVVVTDVTAGGPADRAGLQAASFDADGNYQSGSILVSVDGRPLTAVTQLVAAIERAGIGGRLELGVWSAKGVRPYVVTPRAWPGEEP
jgi:S1-C subfamily serine protease